MLTINNRTGKRLSKKYIIGIILEEKEILKQMVKDNKINQQYYARFCSNNKCTSYCSKEATIKYYMNKSLESLGHIESLLSELILKHK